MTGSGEAPGHTERMTACAHMASVVAHELNNSLAVISSYAELAAVGVRGLTATDREVVDQLLDDLEQIQEAAASTGRLTMRLASFAQGGSGEHVPVSLDRVVTDVAARLSAPTDDTFTIEVSAEPEALVVVGSPTDLEELVAELLQNAVESGPDPAAGPAVLIDLRLTDDEIGDHRGPNVRLQVRDQGTGMDEATRARAFDPFFSTKGRGAGRGLGLASAYGVVRRAGGSIELASEPGRGTTVTVLLPAGS